MDSFTFLEKVLPDTGLYCLGIAAHAGLRERYYESRGELAASAAAADSPKNNIYFCISSLGARKRIGGNVDQLQAVVLDLDIRADPGPSESSKSYVSLEEAASDFSRFQKATGLPDPILTFSGRGLQVFYVFNRPLPEAEWTPLALGLKALCQDQGLRADPSVTGDKVRFMRVPGTTNSKSGRESCVLRDAPEIDPEVFRDLLPNKHLIPSSMPRQPGPDYARPSGDTRGAASIIANMDTRPDIPPAVADLVYGACAQVKYAVDTSNLPDTPEPLWYALLGVAAFCEDPEATAIKWSERYPGYDKSRTLDRVQRYRNSVTGATLCERFRDLDPDKCAQCPHASRVRSPIMLGVRTPELPQGQPMPAFSAPVPVGAPAAPPLPKPFKRTADGIKIVHDGIEESVCPFDIEPISYGEDEALSYEVVRFHWDRPHVGWRELYFRNALLASTCLPDFTREMADQGILLENKEKTSLFQLMLRRYMDELRKQRTVTNLYSTMGWKFEGKEFAIGDSVYRCKPGGAIEKEDLKILPGSGRVSQDKWGVAGSFEDWRNFSRVLDTANLLPHMFVLGVSMSAPLYKFTGLHGLTVSLHGDTGAGKTIAQLWAQSVWGNPEELHFAAQFTLNALFSRMGTYCHLPVTVDEATTVSAKDASNFIFWMSQGRDKLRLDKNSAERRPRTWDAPSIISTNIGWVSKLDSMGGDTSPQKARLLELKVPVRPMFQASSDAGKQIAQFLGQNYGHLGRELVSMFLQLGEAQILADLKAWPDHFRAKYNCQFLGDERFWEMSILLADYTMTKAYERGWLAFDPSICIRWAIDQAGDMRRTAQESFSDSFTVLAAYLNTIAGSTITAMYTGRASKAVVDTDQNPRGEIFARYNLFRRVGDQKLEFDRGDVQVDQKNLRDWLTNQGYDWANFKEGLGFALQRNKARKAYLARDSGIRLPQCNVITVDLSHADMRGILTDAEDSALSNQTANITNIKQ